MSEHEIDPQAVAQALYPEAQPKDEPAPQAGKTPRPGRGETGAKEPDQAGPQPGAVSEKAMERAARQAAQALEKNRSLAVKDLQQRWGKNYARNLEMANKAVSRFGGQALVEELAASGDGLNPATVRAWYRVGQAISEDSFVGGQGSRGMTQKDIAKILYDKS